MIYLNRGRAITAALLAGLPLLPFDFAHQTMFYPTYTAIVLTIFSVGEWRRRRIKRLGE